MASEKPGSSVGCCILKIVAVMGAFALMVALVMGIFAWRAVSWVAHIPESAPANHPPLVISEGEKEDVSRVRQKLQVPEHDRGLLDESIKPIVLNGVIETLLKEWHAQNKDLPAQVIRTNFDGDLMKVEGTWKDVDKQGQTIYYNIVATFDLEIEEGKINKLALHKFSAGGREAPALVPFFINRVLSSFKEAVNNNTAKEAKKFEVVKLLRREGDYIHIILDKAKFEQETKAEADDGGKGDVER
jgi:hypothetical protein